jgi:hypothetical protein
VDHVPADLLRGGVELHQRGDGLVLAGVEHVLRAELPGEGFAAVGVAGDDFGVNQVDVYRVEPPSGLVSDGPLLDGERLRVAE